MKPCHPEHDPMFYCPYLVREITEEKRKEFVLIAEKLKSIWHDKSNHPELRKSAQILYMSYLGSIGNAEFPWNKNI